MPPVESVKFSAETIQFGSTSTTVTTANKPTKPKSAELVNTDHIELPEIDSEYSDEEPIPKSKTEAMVPDWAESPYLRSMLRQQAQVDPEEVFGPLKPLQMDDLFKGKGAERAQNRFRPRSSSATWTAQDKLSSAEIEEYAKSMGYKS